MNVGQYLDALGADARFTGAQTPFDLEGMAEGTLPDVVLGAAGAGQVAFDQARARSFLTLWEAVPDEFRAQVFDKVQAVLNQAQVVSGALLSAAPWAGAVVQAALSIAQLWRGYVDRQAREADSNLFKARMKFWGDVAKLQPAEWYGRSWHYQDYKKTRPWPDDAVRPRIYPPTQAGAAIYRGPIESLSRPGTFTSGCEGGSPQFAGGKGNCKDAPFRIYPAFYPIFHAYAVGPDTTASAGMARDGASIEPLMLAIQSLPLTDPAVNVRVDGTRVRSRYAHMLEYCRRQWQWEGGTGIFRDKPKPKGAWLLLPESCEPLNCRDISGAAWVQVDKEFNKDNPLRGGFYWSPDGLIGTYDSAGKGSTSAKILRRLVLRANAPWTSSLKQGYGRGEAHPAGGNWISAANFNAVRTAYATFMTFRATILKRPATLRSLAQDGFGGRVPRPKQWWSMDDGRIAQHVGKNDYYPVPEPLIRRAIRDAGKMKFTMPTTGIHATMAGAPQTPKSTTEIGAAVVPTAAAVAAILLLKR